MHNFVHPNHHGTVFALKQWLHQREATCIESSKMYCPRRCRKPTYQCGAENSTLHGGRYGIENGKMQNFVHPNYHATVFALKQWLHEREATCIESSKMYCPRRCRNRLTSAGPKNSTLHGGRYGIENGKMQNFVHPNYHGTVFALKQWLHHREATCMESSKMYCPLRCRKPTYQCGAEK